MRPPPPIVALDSTRDPSNKPPSDEQVADDHVAELAVDLWKIFERAKADNASDRVLAACERALDRLAKFEYEIEDMRGRVYDTSMRVRVVHHEEGDGPILITKCITPAVFYRGCLVRKAEVVTGGKE